MTRIPHAVPSAEPESNVFERRQQDLSINCRICNYPIEIHLRESDFENENGERLLAISKIVECPGCGTMNTRYFSWEMEFGFGEYPSIRYRYDSSR